MRSAVAVLLTLLTLSGWSQTEGEIRQITYSEANTDLLYNADLKPFYHGVASGDPTPNAVIIWTRVTPEAVDDTPSGTYEVARDLSFIELLQSGSFSTDASKDFTVKVDLQGLDPATFYYYRFIVGADTSITGRTKTAPMGSAANYRMGVVSCSNFQAGMFNGYRFVSQRKDLDAIIHLGDYIYEYAEGGYGYNEETQRGHEPKTEMVSLEDYRLRHSFYKLDADLRRAHQLYPWITTWDDHESTNDSYKDGAQNHTEGEEGVWEERKNFSAQAYKEWMPLRNPDENNPVKIWRTLNYGDLLDIIMIDTRIWGRDEQVSSVDDEAYDDPERTMLGKDQLAWFKEELKSSDAQWRIIGNQVQVMLVNTAPGQPFNLDPWDGYPAERDTVLRYIRDEEIDNVVFLTGDIHTSWAADLAIDPFTLSPLSPDGYNAVTQDGSVATEFVTPSVTSDNLNEILGAPAGSSTGIEAGLMAANSHIKFVELDDHGMMVIDVNQDRVQAQWYVGEILEKDTTPTLLNSYMTADGSNHVSMAGDNFEDDAPNAPNPPEPATPTATNIEEISNNSAVIFNAYPNPVSNAVRVQFGIAKSGSYQVSITDVNGKNIVAVPAKNYTAGVYEFTADMHYLNKGIYFFNLKGAQSKFTYKLLKK